MGDLSKRYPIIASRVDSLWLGLKSKPLYERDAMAFSRPTILAEYANIPFRHGLQHIPLEIFRGRSWNAVYACDAIDGRDPPSDGCVSHQSPLISRIRFKRPIKLYERLDPVCVGLRDDGLEQVAFHLSAGIPIVQQLLRIARNTLDLRAAFIYDGCEDIIKMRIETPRFETALFRRFCVSTE